LWSDGDDDDDDDDDDNDEEDEEAAGEEAGVVQSGGGWAGRRHTRSEPGGEPAGTGWCEWLMKQRHDAGLVHDE
jgi:hypothetical protein